MNLDSAQRWDQKWCDIFASYQKDVRHANYIRAILHPRERSVLEIGAGSFRDMAALCQWGVDCTGIDYSSESVALAKQRNQTRSDQIHVMNAFQMTFENRQFDLSYHNGLWGYFGDEDIEKLLTEQVRVTSRRIVATLHNEHNKSFYEFFLARRERDPLFNIRFFSQDEARALMSAHCRHVEILPVGGGLEDKFIRLHLGRPSLLSHVLRHGDTSKRLEHAERLMCIGTL